MSQQTRSGSPIHEIEETKFEDIDESFEHSNRSFTGSIVQYSQNNIIPNNNQNNVRSHCIITIEKKKSWIDSNTTQKISAFMYDEWANIMNYFWNNTKYRQKQQISITFYGISVKKINDENMAFYLDENTPNSQSNWIEFTTSINRICGINGIKLTKQDITNHFNNTSLIHIKNNENINYLQSKYQYSALRELREMKDNCYVYGYITFIGSIKMCTGYHSYSQQIRIRDESLNKYNEEDLQIMIFGNIYQSFPKTNVNDIIRIHRFGMQLRPRTKPKYWQGLLKLDKHDMAFIVFDGNLAASNGSVIVKHKSSDKYTFNNIIDSCFIKYLQLGCKRRNEFEANKENENKQISIANAKQNEFIYLNEIQSNNERINLMVMITARIDIDDTNNSCDSDNTDLDGSDFVFYWVLWDGSTCLSDNNNTGILKLFNDNISGADNDNEDLFINISHDIGSKVMILVSPEYEMSIQAYNEISIGQWSELRNVFYDKNKKLLIYDNQSKIYSKINISTNDIIQKRMKYIYYLIYNQTNIITIINSIIPHHKYQSYTPIFNIKRLNIPNCKYKIRGRTIDYRPKDVKQFIKYNIKNKKYQLLFELTIVDSSNKKIKVLFDGKCGKQFLGINDVLKDLTKPENNDMLKDISKSMQIILNKWSIIDLCIRSYKVAKYNVICYKVIDTVLIK